MAASNLARWCIKIILNHLYLPNSHHFALNLLATKDFYCSHLPIWLVVASHVSMYSLERLALNVNVPDLIESKNNKNKTKKHFSWRVNKWYQVRVTRTKNTCRGLAFCKVFWSIAVNGLSMLLMQTFGAEFDRSWELSERGCLTEKKNKTIKQVFDWLRCMSLDKQFTFHSCLPLRCV